MASTEERRWMDEHPNEFTHEGLLHVWVGPWGELLTRRCDCPGADEWARLQARVVADHGELTLATFEAERQPEAFRLVEAMAAHDWKGEGGASIRGAFLTGPQGTGKTHLAVGLMLAAVVARRRPEFVRSLDLARLFADAQGYEDAARVAQERLSRLSAAGLLVIDDLGQQRTTASGTFVAQLKGFVEKFPGVLVVTSNLNAQDLAAQLGAPLVSRLGERCVAVQFKEGDYRRELGRKQHERLLGGPGWIPTGPFPPKKEKSETPGNSGNPIH